MIVQPALRSSTTRPVRATRRRGPAPRPAYVLPLTLLLLAVAAASLAGVCRISLEQAVRAAGAREDLQRRWAVTTCRAALLPKAERVLASAERSGGGPSSEARVRLALGGVTLDLVFGDEQAKANLDVLYRAGGRAGTEAAIRALTAGADVRVAPAPFAVATPEAGTVEALQQDEQPRLFESWSQVFGDTPPGALAAPRGADGRSAVADLTCWGDGTLSYRRASVAALRLACPKALGATGAARLVALRQDQPELDLWEALEQLELSEEQQAEAEERLIDESSCHSLWIVARTGGRSWYDLSIADDGEGPGAAATFSW
jgi:hypothetical protein